MYTVESSCSEIHFHAGLFAARVRNLSLISHIAKLAEADSTAD